jgi:hypothetical protein
LAKLDAHDREFFARALRDLLHGEGEFDERFEQFVRACDVWKSRPPTWELVTAPAALVHPTEHFCVQPAALLEQARVLDLPLALGVRPTADGYRAALATARGLRESCLERGLKPTDLLDIHDFVRLTLPK